MDAPKRRLSCLITKSSKAIRDPNVRPTLGNATDGGADVQMRKLLASLLSMPLLFGIWTGTGYGEPYAIKEKVGKSDVVQFVSLASGETVRQETKPVRRMQSARASDLLGTTPPETAPHGTAPLETPQPGSVHPGAGQAETVRPEAVPLRRGGSYRSPPRGYNPGAGSPARTTPSRPDNATRNPATPDTRPTPGLRTGFGGFFGGLFGGLALGTILGGLFNPFAGFSLGYPILSIMSFVLWAVVLFFLFRLFRSRSRY